MVIIGKKKYEELIKRIERLEVKKPTKSEDERLTPAKVIDEWLNGKREQ